MTLQVTAFVKGTTSTVSSKNITYGPYARTLETFKSKILSLCRERKLDWRNHLPVSLMSV
jgi:hypothetical protein